MEPLVPDWCVVKLVSKKEDHKFLAGLSLHKSKPDCTLPGQTIVTVQDVTMLAHPIELNIEWATIRVLEEVIYLYAYQISQPARG